MNHHAIWQLSVFMLSEWLAKGKKASNASLLYTTITLYNNRMLTINISPLPLIIGASSVFFKSHYMTIFINIIVIMLYTAVNDVTANTMNINIIVITITIIIININFIISGISTLLSFSII